MFSCFLIVVFVTLSIRVIPSIFLRHAISKVRSRFSSSFLSVHISAPYSRIDRISTLYSSVFVDTLMYEWMNNWKQYKQGECKALSRLLPKSSPQAACKRWDVHWETKIRNWKSEFYLNCFKISTEWKLSWIYLTNDYMNYYVLFTMMFLIFFLSDVLIINCFYGQFAWIFLFNFRLSYSAETDFSMAQESERREGEVWEDRRIHSGTQQKCLTDR